MGDRKTIQFNPELLTTTNNNKTRKSRSQSDKNIKLRAGGTERKQSLKRNLLKMIRNQQENRQLMELENYGISSKTTGGKYDQHAINNQFEESLNYLNKLKNEQSMNETRDRMMNHNQTMKYRSYDHEINPSYDNVNITLPESLSRPDEYTTPSYESLPQNNGVLINTPNNIQYGCLKNGALPTWRNMHNTRKTYNNNNNTYDEHHPMMIDTMSDSENPIKTETFPDNPVSHHVKNGTISHIRQLLEKKKEEKTEKRIKMGGIVNKKHKKILRRTYKIGKSQKKNTVSVLVSNRTIRNNITCKKNALKQVSISDIKRYLIKKGFIRVGTAAPNDILRNMYESAMLVCGEIENHNPENLLYNFLNSNN